MSGSQEQGVGQSAKGSNGIFSLKFKKKITFLEIKLTWKFLIKVLTG